jgi:hypothetical protein
MRGIVRRVVQVEFQGCRGIGQLRLECLGQTLRSPTTGRFVIRIIHWLSPKMFTTRELLVWMPLKSRGGGDIEV